MNKKITIIIILIAAIIAVIAVTGKNAVGLLKAEGYIEYTVDEAVELAHRKCAQCHSIDKTAKYCMRCGPPFIVVVHNMRTLILQLKGKKAGLKEIRSGEAAAITQVWNALVGNWENSWREEDLLKLLEKDEPLIKLMNTPVPKRKIETALKGKSAGGSDMMIMKPIK